MDILGNDNDLDETPKKKAKIPKVKVKKRDRLIDIEFYLETDENDYDPTDKEIDKEIADCKAEIEAEKQKKQEKTQLEKELKEIEEYQKIIKRENKIKEQEKQKEQEKREAFLNYNRQHGLSETTSKQYFTQFKLFLRTNGYTEIEELKDLTDKSLLNICKVFCTGTTIREIIENGETKEIEMDNKRVYIRKFMVIKLLKFIGKEHLIKEFREETKILNKKLGRKKENLIKTVSNKDFKKIINSLPEPYNIVCRCQYELGARVSEVLNLTREQLESKKSETGDRIKIIYLQKGKTEAIGVLTKETSVLLKNYWNEKYKQGYREHRLFNLSYQIYERNLVRLVREIMNDPKYKFSSHFCKHMLAKKLIVDLKKNIFEVQKALNHRKLTSTEQYFFLSAKQQEKQACELEENPAY